MKQKRKRVCPHCGKEIKPKPKIEYQVFHYKYYHCRLYNPNTCRSTTDRGKVTCSNCRCKLMDFERHWATECPTCHHVMFHSQDKQQPVFCNMCGKRLVIELKKSD